MKKAILVLVPILALVGWILLRSPGPTEPANPISGTEQPSRSQDDSPALIAAKESRTTPEAMPDQAIGSTREIPEGAAPATLTGTLVDPLDAPVANAKVTLHLIDLYNRAHSLWSTRYKDQHVAQTLSDDDGRFRFSTLDPSHEFGVRAASAGHATTGFGPYSMRSAEVSDVGRLVVPHEARIEGRVVDDSGRSIGNAEVHCWNRGKTTTEEDGTFLLDGLPTGSMSLSVTADGFVPLDRTKRIQLEVTSGETVSPRIVMQRAGEIRGRVIDDQGIPLSGVLVFAGDPKLQVDFQRRSTKTEADGTFVLRSLPLGGDRRIEASRLLYRPATKNVPIGSSVELVLSKFPVVLLRVVDAESNTTIDNVSCGVAMDGRPAHSQSDGPTELGL